MSRMPVQKPGKSFQAFATPHEFIHAVVERWGPLSWDLAADETNVIPGVNGYFSKEQNSLLQDWRSLDGNLWLNPEYADISPWACKLAEECSSRKAFSHFLVPASVGSNWYHAFCHNHGYVNLLSPRMSFDGKGMYPKDLILVTYGYNMRGMGRWVWR